MKKKYECNECNWSNAPGCTFIDKDGSLDITYITCKNGANWQEVRSKEEKSKERIVRKAIGASIEDLAKRIEELEKLTECLQESKPIIVSKALTDEEQMYFEAGQDVDSDSIINELVFGKNEKKKGEKFFSNKKFRR